MTGACNASGLENEEIYNELSASAGNAQDSREAD